jgi:hypothetical protein
MPHRNIPLLVDVMQVAVLCFLFVTVAPWCTQSVLGAVGTWDTADGQAMISSWNTATTYLYDIYPSTRAMTRNKTILDGTGGGLLSVTNDGSVIIAASHGASVKDRIQRIFPSAGSIATYADICTVAGCSTESGNYLSAVSYATVSYTDRPTWSGVALVAATGTVGVHVFDMDTAGDTTSTGIGGAYSHNGASYKTFAVVTSASPQLLWAFTTTTVDIYDMNTRAYIETVDTSSWGSLSFRSVSYDAPSDTILISNIATQDFMQVDVSTRGVIRRMGVDQGWGHPTQGAIDPLSGKFFVPVYFSDMVYKFNSDGSFDGPALDLSLGRAYAVIFTAATVADGPQCELEDESCNYQPEPPVVTFSDVVVQGNQAYYRIQMNASAHWNDYVRVVFPNSDGNWCDYPSSSDVTWSVQSASDDPCMKQYSADIAMSDFLGKCGFDQEIRNSDSLLFQQTVHIQTNRTCEDPRIGTVPVTRETQYEVQVIAPTNATASIAGLEVFGTAFKLDLLGDLTITPDIDTNMPTITGFFVTETQHPYELHEPVFELTGDFNYATFELTGTYCTADNTNRPACQQTWSYSFQPNQTCPDKAQLEGELVQITWNVNCSDGFDGECAPSFAVQPEATFSLNSPVYCFSSDYIELTPALEVYQFDQLTVNSANFDAASVGTLTDNGFSAERVFTIDSQLYAEYTVVAAGTGVTLTATTLKKVSTTTSSRGELVLYETNAAEQVITQATTFSVHDTGFGTDESSDFADYRTRFQFTWLNDTTVLLDSTEDLAQTIALSATAISIFTNVQSLRKAGIDERHPILSKLNSDRHSKEQEDSYMTLFADGDEPRDSKTTVLARLAPTSTNTPAASTTSSGFVVSPTVAAAGIALIAVVALVAFAVMRKDNKSNESHKPSLPASSSGVQLTDVSLFNQNDTAGLTGSTTSPMNMYDVGENGTSPFALQTVADQYAVQQQ